MVFLEMQNRITGLLNNKLISLDDAKQLHNFNIMINHQKLGILRNNKWGGSSTRESISFAS